MLYKIKLLEDFGYDKAGSVITVTERKMNDLIKNNIKFINRLTAPTGKRIYEFEKPPKDEEE